MLRTSSGVSFLLSLVTALSAVVRYDSGALEVGCSQALPFPCVHCKSGFLRSDEIVMRLRGGRGKRLSGSHMMKLRDPVEAPHADAKNKKAQDSGSRNHKGKDHEAKNHDKVSKLKRVLQAKLSKDVPSPAAGSAGGKVLHPSDDASEQEEEGGQPLGKKKVRQGSFGALGLSDDVIKGMYHAGYRFPTPIQRKLIPHVLNGSHVVAMARTGSGKTAAFLSPIICRLVQLAEGQRDARKIRGIAGLVLLPTRELALQSFQFFKTYAKFTLLTGCLISGGEPIDSQFAALATNPDIVFATPGRLLQILDEVPTMSLKQVRICVLDEADRLFESSLYAVVHELLARMKTHKGVVLRRDMAEEGVEEREQSSRQRQMVLVSATLPHQLSEFTKTDIGEEQCVFVRLDTERLLAPTLRVAFFFVLPASKLAGLLFLLKDIVTAPATATAKTDIHGRDDPFSELTTRGLVHGSDGMSNAVAQTARAERKRCLIFCATKYSVDLIETVLRHAGLLVAGVHGRMDQDQRKTALESFKKREIEALVVTDVAARGLDIPLLDYVINYDIPATPKLFVHRAGRAGRAGAVGTVYSMVSPLDLPHTLDTALFLGRKIDVVPPSDTMAGQSILDSAENFLIGRLPMLHVTYWNDFTWQVFERDSSLEGQAKSARRAHALYARTCPRPSKRSVEIAKQMLENRTGTQKVHWWFRDWTKESGEAELEEQMDEARDIVLRWAPKNKSSLSMDWQQDLWDMTKPFQEMAKQRAGEIEQEMHPMEIGNNEEGGPETEKIRQGLEMAKRFDDDDDDMSDDTPTTHRGKLRAQQAMFGDGDSEVSEQEVVQRKGLRVKTGGSMGDAVKDMALDIAPDDAQGIAEANRQRPKKIWDKKKNKYMFPDQLNPQQARELKIIKNEAGERVRLLSKKKQFAKIDGDDEEAGGKLYREWASKAKVRVQKVGEYENKKLVKKAAEKAFVPIRNKLAGETRFGASIIAGAKRTTPAVTRMEAAKGAALSPEERHRLKHLKDRRIRAESQRQKIAMRKTGGVGELPRKLKAAMELKAQAMSRGAKGLRVGGKVGMDIALQTHKKMMKAGEPKRKGKTGKARGQRGGKGQRGGGRDQGSRQAGGGGGGRTRSGRKAGGGRANRG